jgi:peptidoglycan hydrolase-like protein with peptidoglycan-binding domain
LRARGHAIAVDGIFGPQADAAVKAFQTRKDLTANGPVGPETWRRRVTWQALVSGILSGYAISPLSATPNADQNRWNHSLPAALTFPLG